MIEIVKEGKSEIYKREIPRNVRQIGEVKGKTKVYIEDYITTFMKQVSTMDDKPKALILYGDKQRDGDVNLLFVDGAVLAECQETSQDCKTVFQESVWKDVNEKAGLFFKNSMVLGWIYMRYDLSDFVEAPVVNTHKEFFREGQQIFMEYSVCERTENLYLFDKGTMELQSGYFIYYERNEAMQNYMITIKQDESEEVKPEVDKATKRFRGISAEKKEEAHRKQTMGLLYGTSVAMLLIVTVLGVTMLNNYEKMQNMERVLYDISAQIVDEEKAAEPTVGTVETVHQTEDVSEKTVQENLDSEDIIPGAVSGNLLVQGDKDAKLPEVGADVGVVEPQSETEVLQDNMSMEEDIVEPTSVEEVLEPSVDPVVEGQEGYIIPGSYTIEKGDTLAKISKRFYGDESMVDKLCEVNGIEDKNSIQYGVNIILP